MDDLISREQAIDAFRKELTVGEAKGSYVTICSAVSYEGAKHILESLPSAQQWIPCSERLPEEGIEVVTVDKDGDYEINHIIDEEDGEWFWEKAIAWIPLPKPYERKEE